MNHDNETAIKAGKFMVIAHGTREEVAWTQDIFRTNGVATLALRERSRARCSPRTRTTGARWGWHADD